MLGDSQSPFSRTLLAQCSTFFSQISLSQMSLLKAHLARRATMPDMRSGLGVVYDITQWCNQGCVLCCTNARRIHPTTGKRVSPERLELNTEQVITVLRKIAGYAKEHGITSIFINFGGGEPFLRPDFVEIVEEASRIFGPKCVGFDTNGTRANVSDIEKLVPSVAYIGISLDGLEAYHNQWRKTEPENGFVTSTNFLQAILAIPGVRDRLEVSTVPTKANLGEIPDLMRFLHQLGVNKYSLHRTMPVGRAWLYDRTDALRPEARDYLNLMVSVLEANRDLEMDVHFHHSIESIYAALLLGYNTYSSRVGDPDSRSSIGIDWRGRVYFDPWCLVEPLSLMFAPSAISLIDDTVTLDSILRSSNDGVRARIEDACSRSRRCKGCPVDCSGGSRIAATFHSIRHSDSYKWGRNLTMESVLQEFDAIDPVCPLYADRITPWTDTSVSPAK